MKTLQFEPKIYRVVTNGSDGNTWTWDLLTLDGETPRDTVYFLHKEDMPSWNQSNQIEKKIENEDWNEITLEEAGHEISEFTIDKSIFDTAGEGYEQIRKELSSL